MTQLVTSIAAPQPSPVARSVTAWTDQLSGLFDLEVEPMLDDAMRATGLQAWGDASFREGLERLLYSARNDAALNGVGRLTLRWSVAAALRSRLRQVAASQANHSALATPLRRPIVIAAPPRCGTTLLQRLLAAHPDAMSLPLWLALDPFPAPSAAEWTRGGSPRRRARAHVVARSMDALMPAMRSIHTTGADLAVECTWLMLPAFQSVQWMSSWPVHSYADWLVRQDGAPAYRWLREALQLLQANLPGTHWVLKAPGHFSALTAVLDTLPEALVVQLHRDPAVFVGSVASLVALPHHVHSHRPQYHRSVTRMVDSLAAGAQAAVVERERRPPERFVDIAFADLAQAPLATARVVAERAGLRWDAEVEAVLAKHLAAHREAGPGKHRYPLDAWGLRPEAVREQFSEYIERFNIHVKSTVAAPWSDQ